MARRRPSVASVHADWLRLLETSGPFLSLPVLADALGHGLDAVETDAKQRLRNAYEEWSVDPTGGHAEWLGIVVRELLEYEDRYESSFAEWNDVPKGLRHHVDEHAEMLWPQLVIHESGEPDEKTSRLLVCIHPRAQRLEKGVAGSRWAASPQSRMAELCRATGVRLGLVTNGEQWCLVDAPTDETVGYATWYAQLWLDEPNTFAAFRSLLGRHRFFAVGQDETLEALLTKSRENQHEVTDQLGLQVRRAVEMLVRTLDRADQDLGGELLKELEVGEIYEAAVTVMMRLVFLFSAEERGLLLLGDPLFDQYYAVSTLCEQLREVAEQHGEEILERRRDAWCRLLAAFRAVHSGVHHDRLQIPAYGGGLFDPDRFPFLEGRQKGTTWQDSNADPLPVDNRTVLHCLDSLQYLQTKIGRHTESRRLSFRALDIEQIGHVYEGLLDHTAVRANGPTLGLYGKDGDEPEIELTELESLASQSRDKLVEHLAKLKVKSSKRSIETLLDSKLDADRIDQIRRTCGTDELWQRVEPFASLISDDDFGHPIVILEGQLFATAGLDRRSTGTHYTPRSLTEPIVEHTLEPLVYEGPAEGTPREKWKLRSPKEILDLKVCDMACGSGAFLVQACRYLGDRLMESWTEAERRAPEPNPGKLTFPTIDYDGSPATTDRHLVPKDPDERLLTARRLIAQRCLYGVDVNPVAAEMAKLSIWLLTLSKDKPFSFLDHAIRSGDSLLGIHDIRQLQRFSLNPNSAIQTTFSSMPITDLIEEASGTRIQIEQLDSDTIGHVQAQARLLDETEARTARLRFAADMLISGYLQPAATAEEREDQVALAAVKAGQLSPEATRDELWVHASRALVGKRPFHWPLEFPEVFDHNGFDAFIGNPPFHAGAWLVGLFGAEYRDYLVSHIAHKRTGLRGTSDLCGYFLLRAVTLLQPAGVSGFVATSAVTDGDTHAVTTQQLATEHDIFRAWSDRPWPGSASVRIVLIWISRTPWTGQKYIDSQPVSHISSRLTDRDVDSVADPMQLPRNKKLICKGHELQGDGFKITVDHARQLLADSPTSTPFVAPLLTGDDVNNSPGCEPKSWAINFRDLSLDEASMHTALMALVEAHVKPARLRYTGTTARERYLRENWWLYRGYRKEIETFASTHSHLVVRSVVSKHNAWALAPSHYVFTAALTTVLDDRAEMFGILQSSIHGLWASRYASSLGGTSRYIAGRCFKTFPFPDDLSGIRDAATDLLDQRDRTCREHELGLTDLYNRLLFDESLQEPLRRLRVLHETLDLAVLHSYGWQDLADCACHGLYSINGESRYSIDPQVCDTIVMRLLQLNERITAPASSHLDQQRSERSPADTRTSGAHSLFHGATPT